MEHYSEIIKNILTDLENEGSRTREQILKDWAEGETGDDFGNMTGSRTCNAWQAEQDLKLAGFPFDDEINALFTDCGYNMVELLERGPEVVDVIICELLAPQIASELN